LQIFEYVLLLLAAVLVSNLVNRFIPVLSVPILQIVLGILIALIPFGAFSYGFKLDPELFFVLFLAPLVFHTSMTANKKTLWELRAPIITTAVVLVIITAVLLGYILNAALPLIPLAVCFALVSALGPTDIVAVNAVEKRVKIPEKIMGILSGESIINDASGIVCFQFSIVAVTAGSFSIISAAGQFLLLCLGGIVLGLILTWLKYLLIKWLVSFGIENNTLHILIGILTPFLFYMIAESLHVSGILCVFAAGIAHSFRSEKLNPDKVNLNIAQESVWSMLCFTFDGLVFVILGTQLPGLLKTAGSDLPLGDLQIVICVLVLTLIIAAFRFIWWSVTVRKKIYQDGNISNGNNSNGDKPIGKIRSGIIFSLAGARGTVTLATVMSIPMALENGEDFPQRSLIITLACGVIVVSLLITNFILPFFAERRKKESKDKDEEKAYSEIIQGVIDRLSCESTNDNRVATERVIRSYYQRKNAPPQKGIIIDSEEERDLLLQTFLWEKENTLTMREKGSINEQAAARYIEIIDDMLHKLPRLKKRNPNRRFRLYIRNLLKYRKHRDKIANTDTFIKLNEENVECVLNKLEGIKTEDNAEAVDKVISLYELTSSFRRVHKPDTSGDLDRPAFDNNSVNEIALKGFSIERELIQEMYEAGGISWENANEMRNNIITLEARIRAE